MGAAAQPNPQPGAPPPGVTLGPPVPQPPPGVSLGAPVSFTGYAGAPPAAAAPSPAAPPVTPSANETPAQNWERLRSVGLKTWLQGNLQLDENNAQQATGVAGALDRTGMGFAKGLMGLAGFGAHLLATVGDQPSNQDAVAYQKEHPQASQDEVMLALNGEDANGNRVQAYRAPQNRQVGQHLHETADWFKQNAKTDGFWEGLGSTGEQLVELLGTEGLGELAKLRDAEAVGDAAKTLTMSDKLKQIQGVASFLEKNPRIAKAVGLGLRTMHAAAKAGAVGAAQTYVHTQDPKEAATAGVVGGVLGGGIEGAAAAASKLIQHIAPQVETIAGREVPILRSQVTTTGEDGLAQRPTMLQKAAANTDDSQAVIDQQQRAATESVQGAAQGVLSDELGKVNKTRTAPTNALPSSTDPYTFRIKTTPATEAVEHPSPEGSTDWTGSGLGQGRQVLPNEAYRPGGEAQQGANVGSVADATPSRSFTGEPIRTEPNFMHIPPEGGDGSVSRTGGGEISTQDPKLAQAHLESVNRVIGSDEFAKMTPEQQATYTGQADDISRQLAEYHQQLRTTQPFKANFHPVNVPLAIKQTGNFGDASRQLASVGKEVYDHLNSVSGGEWQAMNDRMTSLQGRYWSAVGEQRDQIGRALAETKNDIQAIFDNPKSGVDQTDLTAAKRAWKASYMLQDLHNALEPAYQVDADYARRGTAYRGFNGSQAIGRFRTALRNNPDLKNMLGTDVTDNLQRVFQLNTTVKGRLSFGEGVGRVAKFLSERIPSLTLAGIGYHLSGIQGAAELGGAAESVYALTKIVLHKVATDPQVGRTLLYAIDHARPESYAPTIGNMILRKSVPLFAGTVAQQFGGQ